MREPDIAALVGPVVESCGLEVDRIEILQAGKRKLLRIFLDGDGLSGRGPSLDEIGVATRAISDVLDASVATGQQPYTLEVSSRGVSRPLVHPKHFRRNVGRLLLVNLVDQAQLTGRILAADEDSVTLDVDGSERRVALADIAKAVVHVELSGGLSVEDEDETDAHENVEED